jgi:hypothetical protein
MKNLSKDFKDTFMNEMISVLNSVEYEFQHEDFDSNEFFKLIEQRFGNFLKNLRFSWSQDQIFRLE